MFSAYMTKYFGLNWRTNLTSFLAFLATVPAILTGFENWSHHMPVDYRGMLFGLAVSIGLAAAKDGKNKTTLDQAVAEQAKVDATTPYEVKDAEAKAKEADKQAAKK